MKTRLLVHIALNAKGARVGYLVCAAGRFIPFQGNTEFEHDRNERPSFWLENFSSFHSVYHFKSFAKQWFRAVRFQRVILEGDAA